MRINLIEVTAKIKLASKGEGKHENILASASITLKDDEGGYFTISGFTVWRSKHGGLNVTVPQSRHFKYLLFEPGTSRRFMRMILEAYEFEKIPVINS